MTTALLLLRTPLQAWIAQQVLVRERVQDYDLLYFTQNDAPEDRHYFEALATKATRAKYLYAPIRRFDILGHLDFRKQAAEWLTDIGRDLVMMASIDSHVLSAIAHRQHGDLVTFDDGTANIDEQGLYHQETLAGRARLYRFLLGATNLQTTKSRIARHYTLYPKFSNIVEAGRLRYLDGWSNLRANYSKTTPITYFIGGPFEEDLTKNQIATMFSYLQTLSIDVYVRHPRERNPFQLSIPFLEKKGCIAEDAILADSVDSPIQLVGWFSTVMLNLSFTAQKNLFLMPRDHPKSQRYAELVGFIGGEVVWL